MNTILTGDCIQHLNEMRAGCVDLAFADPPFNIGFAYDVYKDDQPKDAYLAWTDSWLSAVKRVLKPDGALFVAIGDEYAAEMKLRLDALGMTMRNWIIWHYTFGVSCSKKFNRSHAHIFYYVMNKKRFTFNDEAIRVPSARQTTYNDKRANPAGKVPDDTWLLRPQEDQRAFSPESDSWYVSRICANFHERQGHPCQMPELALDRIIKVASNPGELVLDPFAGSGTTLAAAYKLKRKYLGIELSAKYADMVRERLAAIQMQATGTLFGGEVTS